MKIVLFGATGMVGQGVLRECLKDPSVTAITAVVRSTTGIRDPKLREIVHKDFFDFASIEGELAGHDACFFCLGVTSAGMKEPDYARLTYDITMAAARACAAAAPGMAFVYVSGQGTDSTEKGRSMWARVKGRTENALFVMPQLRAYAFRPGYIQPVGDIKSKTGWYRAFYVVAKPLYPLLKRAAPGSVTTTEEVGRAMLRIARERPEARIAETPDIARLGA